MTPKHKPGYFLVKWLLEQLQIWQDYSNNTLYAKQTAIPLHAIQNIELFTRSKKPRLNLLQTEQTNCNTTILLEDRV